LPWSYAVADWHVASDLRIPGLLIRERSDRLPDIIVRWPAPRIPIANLVRLSPVLHVARMGTANFDVPNICSCSVIGGRYVGIAPYPAATEGAIRCVLLGPALAALSHQRRVLPLRGTCIRRGNDAIAFIGAPGAGKTALALGLARYGWRFHSDGLVLVDAGPAEPIVWFSYSGALVWRHTTIALAIDHNELEQANPAVARYFLAPSAQEMDTLTSVRLNAVYIVSHGSEVALDAVRLPQTIAEKQILTQVVLEQLAHFYDSVEFVRGAVRNIADRVPCYALAKNYYCNLLDQLAPVEMLLCSALA
jgi:hypothetical protein